MMELGLCEVGLVFAIQGPWDVIALTLFMGRVLLEAV